MCTSSSCFCWMWSWIYIYRTLGLCLNSGSASFKVRIRRVVMSHRCTIHRKSKETPIAYLKCTLLGQFEKCITSTLRALQCGRTLCVLLLLCFFKDGALLTKHSNTTILYNYLKSKLNSSKETTIKKMNKYTHYKTLSGSYKPKVWAQPCQELAPNCLYWSLQGLLTEARWPHLSYIADIALRRLVFFINISMNVVLL